MTRVARAVPVALLATGLALGGCTGGGPATPGAGAGATGVAGSSTGTHPADASRAGTTGATSTAPSTTSAPSTAPPPVIGEPTSTEPVPVAGRSKRFTVLRPPGWAEATDRAADVAGLEVVLVASPPVQGYAENLVVVGVDGGADRLRQELDRGRRQLQAGGRPVTPAPDRVVDGERATGYTTAFEQQGLSVVATTYGVAHAGRVYLVTLSSSAAAARPAAGELDTFLRSWRWTP